MKPVKEIRALRDEIAALRAEVASLRAELAMRPVPLPRPDPIGPPWAPWGPVICQTGCQTTSREVAKQIVWNTQSGGIC